MISNRCSCVGKKRTPSRRSDVRVLRHNIYACGVYAMRKKIEHLLTIFITLSLILTPAFSLASQSASTGPISSSGVIQYGMLQGATLRFKSGYENPVYLTSHRFYGKDDPTSPVPFESLGTSGVVMDLQGGVLGVDDIIEISTVRAHTGTRSLHIKQITYGTQARADFHTTLAQWGTKIYIRTWMYIPSSTIARFSGNRNAASVLGVREIRLSTGDFSNPVNIMNYKGTMRWEIRGLDYSRTTNYWDRAGPPYGFEILNPTATVPVDQWFKLEYYIDKQPLLPDSTSAGEVKLLVNGVPVFEKGGQYLWAYSTGYRTQTLGGIRTANDYAPNGYIYSKICDFDSEPSSVVPIEMWLDDLEIWNWN